MAWSERNQPTEVQADAYRWRDHQGLGSRLMRPGRGMYHDVRRRLPYYWSDLKDGFTYRVFAGTIRIFFVNLLPALAFQLDMQYNTDGFFGVNEALLSSALAAIVFSLLSCQPLTVVGVTGLISLFNYTIYDIVKIYNATLYPHFLVWVGIWAAIFHWATAIFNLCDYMRTITDFSSQTFGLYVGTVYVIKGCEELSIGFENENISNGVASALVAILYFLTVYLLEQVGQTTYTRGWLRTILSDYAYPLATIWWTGFTHFPGNLANVHFEYLPTTRTFSPTIDRPWVVDFWTLSVDWVFIAAPFGFLMTLLFYYDHNVSSLTAQARNFPLQKPAGFHWDFFLLGCTCFVGGILNIPLPNGLVPQAPVHTDSLTYYKDEPYVIETKDETEPTIVRKETVADRVAEQRISHFLMGLALFGAMSGPLLTVLSLIPRAIISGVFFTVGMGSILTNPILTHKLAFLLRDPQFQRPSDPLNSVPRRQIGHYLFWQLLGFASTVAISQTIAAIGFPVLIVALIPLRWKVLPHLFTRHELEVMDCLTATGDVVLASLGGKPEMPEAKMGRTKHQRPDDDIEPGFAGLGGGMIRDEDGDLGRREREKNARLLHGLGYDGGAITRRRSSVVSAEDAESRSQRSSDYNLVRRGGRRGGHSRTRTAEPTLPGRSYSLPGRVSGDSHARRRTGSNTSARVSVNRDEGFVELKELKRTRLSHSPSENAVIGNGDETKCE
ncbi:uncharacterized protein Z518_10921 [Rhinocladiella mackenziei CBS 650.93]|uniref:Bicarbonate transporter-like transmembrane domain-containing protein n=1 Tax=Rhinocladiella mackenziei CBS 650.93 TaxID=1442369 RepID=A0A0D2I2N9_9EURO|nr:uncharacterized protein Z518_10921 [Rhinocladiella mackenziei CBS 650.93]KIW99993.1 hypothetical protein Z518_10921 [Rhinocladiella mackenziei CBS 650.93]